jgi:hypothetical protein
MDENGHRPNSSAVLHLAGATRLRVPPTTNRDNDLSNPIRTIKRFNFE